MHEGNDVYVQSRIMKPGLPILGSLILLELEVPHECLSHPLHGSRAKVFGTVILIVDHVGKSKT